MLHIDRLEARYRVPPARTGAKSRLDRVLRTVLDRGLDAAFAGREPADEILCVRALHLPVRLALDQPDWRLVEAWSHALAGAIGRAIRAGGSLKVVRYASPRAALLDLALGVVAGDLERAWAWRAAGLARIEPGMPARTATRHLVAALRREPERIVPTLVALAARGRVADLAERLDLDLWLGLARDALRAAGAEPRLPLATDSAPARRPDQIRRFVSPLGRSRIALSALEVPAAVRAGAPGEALAALSLLEAEPLLLRRPDAAAGLAAAARALAAGDPAPVWPLRFPPPPGRFDRPDAAAAPARDEPAAGPPATDSSRPVEAARPPEPGRSQPNADPRLEPRLPGGATAWGGLPFLLGIVDQLDLPAELASGTTFAKRAPRWVLHRLALTLLPVATGDPAALVFAGLPPEAAPPDGAHPDASERGALLVWRERIASLARDRLGWPHDADDVVLTRLCRRRAVVRSDPGWIEVHLDLAEVDVDARRGGLDLAPGWIPWLGVVVRFVYG